MPRGLHRCIVPGCGATAGNGITLFWFPSKVKHPDHHKSWCNIVKLRQKPSISSTVCSLHFSDDSFKPSNSLNIILM